MKLAFSQDAANDLESISDFIHRDNPAAALKFVAELRQRSARILDAPYGGSPRPELRAGLRAVPYRRYVIYYTVDGEVLTIRRILHSARDTGMAFPDA